SMPSSRLRSRKSAFAPAPQTPATRTSSRSFASAATGAATSSASAITTVRNTRPVLRSNSAHRNGTLVLAEVLAEPLPLDPQHSLHVVGDVDLAKDARQVRLDGLLADPELPRDQLVRQAVYEQREHL